MDALASLSLVIAVLISTARLVKCSPLVLDAVQLSKEDGEQSSIESTDSNEQERIGTFLTLLDKAERIASARFAAKITGVRVNTKLFGKKHRMDDIHDELSSPSLHQEESADQIDDPGRGKHFRKAVQPIPRKTKKRACFWKYCIHNK